MRGIRRTAILLALLIAACTADLPDGVFACDSNADCPADLVCSHAGSHAGSYCFRGGKSDLGQLEDGGELADGGELSGPDADAQTDSEARSQPCELDRGGCDSLTTCTNQPGAAASCGACPAGYGGSGATGCTPLLISLTSSTGSLSPALGSEVTDYFVDVPLATETLLLTATVPADMSVTMAGQRVASGAGWQTPSLELGANPFSLVVSSDGHHSHTYTVTIRRGYQEAYIKASNAEIGDNLNGLALSGDTLVVGARFEDGGGANSGGGPSSDQADNSGVDSGAAYVFVRDGSTWTQQAYLKASNAGAGDELGLRVAISGDTIVVGARFEDSSATGVDGDQADDSAHDSGAAYVFVRNGTRWTQQAYLKASNTGAGDNFGCRVAISGDTIVVGAWGEDGGASEVDGDQASDSVQNSGAAYVFVRNGTSWSQQGYLKASNAEANDAVGDSVSISDDTIVVGASLEDSSGTGANSQKQADNAALDSGAAYVFVRTANSWSQQAYLKASNTDAGDYFGACLAVSGNTLVVSGHREDGAATGVNNSNQSDNSLENSGAAYVFVRSGSSWTQQAYLKASNTSSKNTFGFSVAISGDRIVVGSDWEDSSAVGVNNLTTPELSAPNSGAAYVFVRSGSLWSQYGYLKASNAEEDDVFGTNVTVSGDTIAVSAPLEDSSVTGVNNPNQADDGAADSGAVYVFR